MYTTFYNLRERPFNLTPDSHFLYLSPLHRDALGHLLYGIRERKGFILVSGEVGTGKTTLCRALIAEIEKEAEIGFILNSFLSAEELLKNINEDLSCHRGATTRKGLVDELNQYLLAQHEAGRNVVVLIDECQNLALSVLEQLRMLSNLETEKEKLLQIVLVGQPELREMLGIPALRQLAQRITVTYHLKPLTRAETGRYIRYRLAVAAGGEPASVRFTDAAVRRIYRYSGGIPRKINIVCDRALLVGFVSGSGKITGAIVRRAVAEIGESPEAQGANRCRLWAAPLFRGAAAAACLIALLLAARSALRPVPAAAPAVSALGPDGSGGAGQGPAGAGADREPAEELAGTVLGTPQEGAPAEAAQEHAAVVSAPQETASPEKEAPLSGTPPAEAVVSRDEMSPLPESVPRATANADAEAATRLAALWGREGPRPVDPASARDLRALAASYGLEAVECWGGVGYLRWVDIPCILFLRGAPGSGAVAAVLSAVRNGKAVLRLQGGETRLCTSRELEEAMCGRAVYFHPLGVAVPGVCAPGMQGPEVHGLQESLKAAGFMWADEGDRYGRETVAAVERLQKSRGLPVDGVAGAAEWMLLLSAGAGEGVPRLFPAARGRVNG